VRAFGRTEGNPFCFLTTANYRYHRQKYFFVRVAAELSPGSVVELTGFHTRCRVKPPETACVALQPSSEGRLSYHEAFASRKILHLAEVSNKRDLEWTRGRMFIRGNQKSPVRVEVRQRFVSPDPLRSVSVRIDNTAAPKGKNYFAVSTDGSNVLVSKEIAQDGGVTELALPDAANARQFFLHIVLANEQCCEDAPTNVLSSIDVEALAARPVTTTAMTR
jgi:hypothetical protein